MLPTQVDLGKEILMDKWEGIRHMSSAKYGKVMGAVVASTALITGLGYLAGTRVTQLNHAGDLIRHPLDSMGVMFLGHKQEPKSDTPSQDANATAALPAPTNRIDTKTLKVAQPVHMHHHMMLGKA